MEHLHTQEQSVEKNYIRIGEEVERMNNGFNDGRGISAIRDVASALKANQVDSAKATIKNEWDKISTYSQVADYLIAEGLYIPIDFSKYLQE